MTAEESPRPPTTAFAVGLNPADTFRRAPSSRFRSRLTLWFSFNLWIGKFRCRKLVPPNCFSHRLNFLQAGSSLIALPHRRALLRSFHNQSLAGLSLTEAVCVRTPRSVDSLFDLVGSDFYEANVYLQFDLNGPGRWRGAWSGNE